MTNKLSVILAQKECEVVALRQKIQSDSQHIIAKIMRGEIEITQSCRFKKALISDSLAIIAEIKRQSPSKGIIAPIVDPVSLARRYIAGGANAISILTDKRFFDGDIHDLSRVVEGVGEQAIPILRKDFIIDDIQIAEAAAVGASAILCIVAAIGSRTKILVRYARSLGLDVLVEIHDEAELEVALESGADIIGINNRHLKNMQVNTDHAFTLVGKIPKDIVKVAESGIQTPALAREYHQAGFQAVLMGEVLVKALQPEALIRECRGD